jgi:hypothetical protein
MAGANYVEWFGGLRKADVIVASAPKTLSTQQASSMTLTDTRLYH